MAEIEIERRPRRRPLSWIALLLVLSAVALGAWLMLRDDTDGGDPTPAAETTGEPLAPSSWSDQPVSGRVLVFGGIPLPGAIG